MDRVEHITRILPVDAQRLHLPLGIGQTQSRVAKEHIAFFIYATVGFSHTIDVAQTVVLAAIDTEQLVIKPFGEVLVAAAVSYPRSGKHGNHATILVEEGILAQRSAFVVIITAELTGASDHKRIHRSIAP